MTKLYDKYEKKGSVSYLRKIEESLNTKIINFGEDFIEFPDLFMITKKSKDNIISSHISMLLHPGVEIFEIDEVSFEEMISILKEDNIGVKIIEKEEIKPKTFSRLNLKKIKEDNIYIKDLKDRFVVDEILFTTSEYEYHGTGMFTARKSVYLLNKDEFNGIRDFFLK